MSESARLLIEVGGLLLVGALLARLANRIGISAIPLFLLGGLAFGDGGLIPLSHGEAFIEVGAEIGVLLLLVMLGLQYSADELMTSLRGSRAAGLLDMVLGAAPGALAGMLLGAGPVGSLMLAGVTWVSSSGVVARVLQDLGRMSNRETPVVLSILVVEDLAMAFYLPVLTAVLIGSDLGTGVVTVVVALAAVVLILYIALRRGRWVSALVWSPHPDVLLLSVLGLTLLVAGLAAQVNVSSAVGAFLVGIAISGPVADRAARVLTPLRDVFAALFFLFFGLSTDPRALVPMLLPAAALAVVSMATKVLTGYLAARRVGIGVAGRWRAGLVLTPRGEFAIVIAGLAVGAGLDRSLIALVTGYVLITVVAGPLLARLPDAPWFARWAARRQRMRDGESGPDVTVARD